MGDFFRRVVTLDIFELNIIFSEQCYSLYLSLPVQALPRAGMGVGARLLAFLKHFILGLVHIGSRVSASAKPLDILFFAYTINQRDALLPVLLQVPNSYLAGHHRIHPQQLFPEFWAYLISIPFFPWVIAHYFKASEYRKRTFRYAFDQYWLTYGYYIVATRWLNHLKPKVIVLSNDHNMHQRVLIKVAGELGIPTVYLQHASVTAEFPPLSFDYALLDGVDALEKYAQAGITDTKVLLIGIPKLDSYIGEINQKSKVDSLGICTNQLEDIESVENVCLHLRHVLPSLAVILRPHPADKRVKQWQDLASQIGAGFSDARTTISFEFFKTVDAVLVGDSNILLEAALVDVYPLYYDFSGQKRDHYGFVRNGLTEYFSMPEQVTMKLQDLMENKPDVQHRTQRYCATIGTPYAGQSSKLASEVINMISVGTGQKLNDKWSFSSVNGLHTYSLNLDLCDRRRNH
jgi:hypothetical protein